MTVSGRRLDIQRLRALAVLATVRRVPRAHMVNTAHYFCSKSTCEMARNGLLLYRDYDHLNINGSRFLAQRMLDDYPALAADVR